MNIVNLEDTWVVSNYEEKQIAAIIPVQKAEFVVDGIPGRKFQGNVDSIMAGDLFIIPT